MFRTYAAVIAAFVILTNALSAHAQEAKSWSAVKSLYKEGWVRSDSAGQFVQLPPITNAQPWENPIARKAIAEYGLNASDILAVQKVVALSQGVPVDSAGVVVTKKQWYYARSLNGLIGKTQPPGFRIATEIDVYGSYIEATSAPWKPCNLTEWVVTFYLPVCFHEIAPGRFDNILDAWAPNPNCSQCNGGICAGYQCGGAWGGPGYLGWWDYNDCSPQWSRKVGKQVQKRWLFT